MLEHLISPENLVEVFEIQTDRDGDETIRFLIGTGYGIFRGQAMEEFVQGGAGKFNSVGTVVFYSATTPNPVTVKGRTYTATKDKPYIGGVCRWHGIEYAVTGVDARTDIHGDLIGYTVRCAND
jgi:hypothetical protein